MNVTEIAHRIEVIRGLFGKRDENMKVVRMVREGRMHEVAGMDQYFSNELPHSFIANTVEIAARDLASIMAPLPDLACTSGNGVTKTDKSKAEKKNRIGEWYWHESRLATQMFKGADYFNSYGLLVLCAEPDFKRCMPSIRVEDPRGFYYFRDRFGNIDECMKVWNDDANRLASLFPEHSSEIIAKNNTYNSGGHVEVVRYSHRVHGTYLVLSTLGMVLAHYPPMIDGCLPYFIVERPSLSDVPGGQFDEAVWIQYAKILMGQYKFRAMERSVNAPIVLPSDAGNLEMGPDSIVQSDRMTPAHGIMNLQVPNQLFAYGEQLDQEAKESAGYPDARTGGVKASIITGRGVEALMGTMDTQLKTAQQLFKQALEDVTEYAFKLDVKYWPTLRKQITGTVSGRSYTITYVAARDIGDDTRCTVSYGFLLGQSPAQAHLLLLQLNGAGVIDLDTVRDKLPFEIDKVKEQQAIDIRRMNESLMSGLLAWGQALGPMVQGGMDPRMVIMPVAKAIELVEKGKSVREAVQEAFTPPEPEPTEEAPMPAEAPPGAPPGMGPDGQLPPNMTDSGLLRGVSPGQAGLPPGSLPDIQTLISGLRGANADPQVSASTMTRRAV